MAVEKLRRDFSLPEDEEEHLDARGLPWETIAEGSNQWLLIHQLPVPDGYNAATATAAIHILPNYQTAGLDMVYFDPPLSRVDGVPLGATDYYQPIDDRNFQRWSRHRTGENPWRPELDTIATHLSLVEEWLAREFKIKPMRSSI